MQYITNRFQALPLFERIDTISSWDSLCKKLRDLPRKKESLEKMSLADLPIQPNDHYARTLPETEDENYGREITGREYDSNVDEGDIEEILPGMDVAVYTEQKKRRPWVGKVLKVDTERNEFEIHWYEKAKNSHSQFNAMFDKNVAVTSMVSLDAVMFWSFTDDRTDSSFRISNYFSQAIKNEYEKLDK